MKKCTRCLIEKEDQEFAKRNSDGSKRSSECKICHRQIRKAYYEANKQLEISRVKANKEEYLSWFQSLKKTLCCEICGEKHIATLQFHHLDPKVKDFSISEASRRGLAKTKILDEIKKCQVLCANCHFKIHWDLKQT